MEVTVQQELFEPSQFEHI